MRLGSRNPVFKYGNYDQSYSGDSATYGGVVNKTAILLGIIAVVAIYFANQFVVTGFTSSVLVVMIGAPIIAIIAVIVTHLVPSMAMFSSIVYALCEGAFLGIISAIYAYSFDGEIIQMALISTFGVMGGMLFLYKTGIIRVGAFFRRMMYGVLAGLFLTSIVMMIVIFSGIGIQSFYSIYIGVVIISVIAASLFLLLDFDRVSRYVEAGASKQREWSLSLGLVTTIVWLYVEFLRLFAIIASRD